MKAFTCDGGSVTPGIALAPKLDDPRKLMINLGDHPKTDHHAWVAVSRRNQRITEVDGVKVLADGHVIHGTNGDVVIATRWPEDDSILVRIAHFEEMMHVSGPQFRLVREGASILIIMLRNSTLEVADAHDRYRLTYTEPETGLQSVPSEFYSQVPAGSMMG